jgi:hypothetical protein
MNNKIIWVFGPSAVGKETFIKYVYNDKPSELIDRLGWGDRKVIICEESLAWVVQEENDGNEALRKNLDKIIQGYSASNTNSIILIKGQDLDFNSNHLNNVKKYLPDDCQEIIFLYTDFDILYNRYIRKKWWNKSMTPEVCKNWIKEQIDSLSGYQEKGFKIRALESGDDKKYLDINFPPIV